MQSPSSDTIEYITSTLEAEVYDGIDAALTTWSVYTDISRIRTQMEIVARESFERGVLDQISETVNNIAQVQRGHVENVDTP